MIRAIALDDEPLALQLLKTFSARFDYIHFEKGFSSTIETLKYLESHPVDLLFLDINMPAISGSSDTDYQYLKIQPGHRADAAPFNRYDHPWPDAPEQDPGLRLDHREMVTQDYHIKNLYVSRSRIFFLF